MNPLSEVMKHLAIINQIGPFSMVESGRCLTHREDRFIDQVEKFIRNIPKRERAVIIFRIQNDESTDPRDAHRAQAGNDVRQACAGMNISALDLEQTVERLATLRAFDTCKKARRYFNLATYNRWRARYYNHGIRGLIPQKSTGRPRKSVDATGE